MQPTPRDFEAAVHRDEVNEALRERAAHERHPGEGPVDTTVGRYTARPLSTTPPPSATQPHETVLERGAAPPAAPVSYGTVPPSTTVTRHEYSPPPSAPFSIAAGFLGWSVATFFTLVLTTLVLAAIGAAAFDAGVVTGATFDDLTTAGIVGGLVAIFAAYMIGGYNAGRIDRHHGLAQGIAVVGWTVVFGILGAILVAGAADFLDLGAYLAPFNVDYGALTTPIGVSLVIMVLVMLVGAVLGGLAGERWPEYGAATTERRRYGRAWRGRPRA